MAKVKTILGKVGFTPKGTWEQGSYDFLDLVTSGGSSYVSRADENTAALTDENKWMLLAKKGETGAAFTFDDFTPEQLAQLKGEKGDPFEYEDFTDEQIEALKKPAIDAAEVAEAAAEEARNLPKIQDGYFWLYDPAQKKYVQTTSPATGKSPKISGGTWWIWDDDLSQYVNTNVSVSSDYELTKAKVEGVLTGDIATHNHAAQLAVALADYVKAVAGKQLSTEDFTTALKNKLNGLSNYDDAAVQSAITTINERIDTLVGGSASTAIDTFREIEAFLAGITDTKTLTGLLNDLKAEITALIPTKLSQLTNDNNTVQDANYVHTDNNYTNAEKAKLAKMNIIPTLDHEPGEDNLTFTDAEGTHTYLIGDFARVFDSDKQEYVFFQLNDIADGKAVWKLSGSGGGAASDDETIIVSLTTNQSGKDDQIIGATINVRYNDKTEAHVWDGQSFTVRIPAGAEYTIEVVDNMLQFRAPAAVTLTSVAGYIRLINLTCLAELAKISARAEDGGNVGNMTVTVTETGSGNIRYQGVIGNGIEVLFPYNVQYRVSWSGESNTYLLPSDASYTANTAARSIVGEFVGLPFSRLIFDKTIADSANITGAGEGAILDIIAKMRRCLVKKTAEGEVAIAYLNNDDSTKYEDGTAAVLTGTEGDVMVYKPSFYYKYEKVDDNQFAYLISEYNIGGEYIHSPASLIGAYKAYQTGSKLYSRSGVAPSGSYTQPNAVIYANARGAGYQIIDVEQHSMIALLFFAKYGNRNSQAILGTGNTDYTSTTGSTNSLGNRDTAAAVSGAASFAGIEGVHGYMYEWVGGVTINNGLWTITTPDGSTRTAQAGATTGWIMEIRAAEGSFFDVIPLTVGGSESTYYADYYNYQTGARVLARSCNGANAYGGVSCTNAYFAASSASAVIGSRLAFRGVIREAESVTAFKALAVL